MMKRIEAGLAFFAVFGLAGTVTFQLVGCSQPKNSKITDKSSTSVEKKKEGSDSSQQVLEKMLHGWNYQEEQDKMGRGALKIASTFSINTVSFGFPYEGEQRGILSLRSHPKQGNGVILSIEKGQFLTGIDGCEVNVRFDDDKPMTFWGNEPADQRTTVIFINGYSKFVSRLIRAKKVMIEAPFFQEGNRIFEFKVDSLNQDFLPKSTSTRKSEGESLEKQIAREKAASDSFETQRGRRNPPGWKP